MDDSPIATPADFPTPATASRRPDLRGTDVTLADGLAWTLADYVPALGLVWDQLYDDNVVAGQYHVADVLVAAARLLQENYDLPVDFVAWLLAGADPDALVAAVEGALFGRRAVIRGYSEWAEAALRANGIDPAAVPPPILRAVLDQLVATRRAVPAADFTSAGIAATKRAALTGINRKIDEAAADFPGGAR